MECGHVAAPPQRDGDMAAEKYQKHLSVEFCY